MSDQFELPVTRPDYETVLYMVANGDDPVERLDDTLADYDVETVINYPAVHDRLPTDDIGCLVIGSGLATENGRALVTTIRDGNPDLPIIVMAANNPAVVTETLAAGATTVVDTDGPSLNKRLAAQVKAAVDRYERTDAHKNTIDYYESTLANIIDTVLVTDADGAFTWICPNVRYIFGYSKSAIADMETIRTLFDGEPVSPDRIQQQGRVENVERTIETKSGVERTVLVTAKEVSLADGTFLYSVRNITRRKANEQELKQLRSLLIRVLRHNIRNELTVIQGQADYVASKADDHYLDHFEKIQRHVEKINRKSQKSLLLAKLTQQEIAFQTHDLKSIINEVTADIRRQFPDVELSINIPDSCKVSATPGLPTAIRELITNAASHNTGSDQWINITAADTNPLELRIEDNGPLIPEREVINLERPNEQDLEHGIGVGLQLTNLILNRSEGSLQIDESDTGNRLLVEVPRLSPDAHHS